MVWFVEGSEATIGFQELLPSIHGTGTQDFSAIINPEGTGSFKGAEALWSIHPSNAEECEIDPLGSGFFNRVQEAPDITHFMIHYHSTYDENSASVGFNICTPIMLFEKYFSIWQNILFHENQIKYVFALDFSGFRSPNAEADIPTIGEWMNKDFIYQKPIFGKGVHISFHNLNGT